MKYRQEILITLFALLTSFGFYKLTDSRVNNLGQRNGDMIKFSTWVKEYGRLYSTPEEFNHRFETFQENLREIEKVQNGGFHYTASLNKFADLSKKEFLTKYTGFKFSDKPRNYKVFNPEPKKYLTQTPHKDWRQSGDVAPVKEQKTCGSCWAFSAIAALETAWHIKNKKSANTNNNVAQTPFQTLSEQQLVDCSFSYGNDGCNGGWMVDAFRYLLDYGFESDKDYPYVARDQYCRYNPDKGLGRIHDYLNVARSETVMMQAVDIGVVAVAIDAGGIQFYKGGIFDGYCSSSVNHGVNVVGYGTENGKNYWIVRNCWGTDWGEQGYARMERIGGEDGKCGILKVASFPTFS